MNSPKVTSITYVKNGEKYIEQCIRSIMHQTLKDIEIIVVDGGSTDGTEQILEKLRDEDSRIELLSVEGSVGAQFNAALKIARGEYVAVCEGDDFILPNKYEKQYEIAKKNKLDVIRACYYLYFQISGKEYRYKVEVAPNENLYDRLIISEDNMFLASFVNGFWNGLYKRQFLVDNHICKNETQGAAFQDITFSFLTQMYAGRIWFMSEPLHCYRIDNPNSSVNSEKCIQMLNREYDLLSESLKERNEWDRQKHMFMGWIISSYKQFFDRFSEEKKQSVIDALYSNLLKYEVSYNAVDLKLYYKVMEIREAFYKGKDSFRDAMFKGNERSGKCFLFFSGEEFKKLQEVILFGAGHFGEIVYDYLSIHQKQIVVVDNSEKKQNEGFRGTVVHKPTVCKESNAPIIIASVHYSGEIRNQIVAQGVDEQRIVICDNEDFFFREIFIGLGMQLNFA